ncbi:GATA type transcriptional activator of nitrogen-regulated proteins [Kickxella alabastrina]|uniref:GATA type transcriptional activator of nitrogen-regulated proteins n=1 Tax=Kickxella alabastrina TaxID=61397 RepID=A0ACC1IX92_9FUNG|nr:GATA type transcriptional activator of nitrogen-regulated proteins [Kickxella alabastrina]
MSQSIPSFADLTKSLGAAAFSVSRHSKGPHSATLPVPIQSTHKTAAKLAAASPPQSFQHFQPSSAPTRRLQNESRSSQSSGSKNIVSSISVPTASMGTVAASKPSGTVCFNCGVDSTPLWRRDVNSNVVCNSCGLYWKLHGISRPPSMKRAVIKRRRRRATNNTSPTEKAVRKTPLSADAPCRSSSLPLRAEKQELDLSNRMQSTFHGGNTMESNNFSSGSGQTSSNCTPWSNVLSYASTPSIPSTPFKTNSSHGMHADYSSVREVRFPRMLGLESLMRAAELSPPMTSHYESHHNKRRYYSHQLPHESLLDSLATVATAEISLSSKRQALGNERNNMLASSSSNRGDMMPHYLNQSLHHVTYREELQRECERLHKEYRPRAASIENIISMDVSDCVSKVVVSSGLV